MSIQERDIDIERAYNDYADLMYRLALTYVHNREGAEDAVHDAFISYMEKAPAFADAAHERAWLCRVTVNKCRDAARKRKVRQYIPLDDADTVSAAAEADSTLAELYKALDKLPDRQRLTAVLHYLEGYPIADVAKMTGTTVSAVKMRLLRARETLRKTLGEEDT